jgi:hypothetical protein
MLNAASARNSMLASCLTPEAVLPLPNYHNFWNEAGVATGEVRLGSRQCETNVIRCETNARRCETYGILVYL